MLCPCYALPCLSPAQAFKGRFKAGLIKHGGLTRCNHYFILLHRLQYGEPNRLPAIDRAEKPGARAIFPAGYISTLQTSLMALQTVIHDGYDAYDAFSNCALYPEKTYFSLMTHHQRQNIDFPNSKSIRIMRHKRHKRHWIAPILSPVTYLPRMSRSAPKPKRVSLSRSPFWLIVLPIPF